MEILEIFNELNNNLNTFLLSAGMWAPLLSSLLIILEGIFAFLPMFVFTTINLLTMGNILGSIVSYICTVAGCFLTFYLCRIGLNPIFQKFIKNKSGLKKFMNMINKMSFSKLVLIISIPLTPSFFVNLAAGLSKMPKKKYLYALLFGKTIIIIFWGFLGTSLIDCLTNPLMLIKVILMIFACNLLSKFLNKKFDLNDIFENK